MKFLDEVTKEFWERVGMLGRYSYQYSVEFEGNNVVIKPSKIEDSSFDLKLFKKYGRPDVKAHIEPIVIDLGDGPIRASITGRLTHDDLLSLLEAAEAEKIIGYISYKMPINSVRLTGFPKTMSNNLDIFRVSDGDGWIMSEHMMTPQPIHAIFNNNIEKKVEELPYVEKIEKEPRKHPKAILSRRPALSEVEQTALSLSENSDVELVFKDLKKSQIKEINQIYDSSLEGVDGSIAKAYSVRPGTRGYTTSISIRPPFDKTIEPLERSFGERIVY